MHRVILEFDDGLFARLVCPEDGCEPATRCAECYRDTRDEGEGCYSCGEGFGEECWLKGWFDNLTPEELLQGRVEVEISAEWCGDHAIMHIADPVAQ